MHRLTLLYEGIGREHEWFNFFLGVIFELDMVAFYAGFYLIGP